MATQQGQWGPTYVPVMHRNSKLRVGDGVVIAYDTVANKTVAIKVCPSPERKRATLEALNALSYCPQVCNLSPESTNELVQKNAVALEAGGDSLQMLLEREEYSGSGLHVHMAAALLLKLVKALDWMYNKGRVHADLSSDSVVDFGATASEPDQTRKRRTSHFYVTTASELTFEPRLVKVGHVLPMDQTVGTKPTVAFMSPEVARHWVAAGSSRATRAANVWALGAMFWFMLTGQHLAHQLITSEVELSDERQMMARLGEVTQRDINRAMERCLPFTSDPLYQEALALMSVMLRVSPEDRPDYPTLLSHPCFQRWESQDTLTLPAKEMRFLSKAVHDIIRETSELTCAAQPSLSNLNKILEERVNVLDNLLVEQAGHSTSIRLTLDKPEALSSEDAIMQSLVDMEKRLTNRMETIFKLVQEVDYKTVPSTFILVPEVTGDKAPGVWQEWLECVGGIFQGKHSLEQGVHGAFKALMKRKFRLYLCCELSGRAVGEGYLVTETKDTALALLPAMRIGLNFLAAANVFVQLASLSSKLLPNQLVPPSLQESMEKLMSELEQKSNVDHYACIKECFSSELQNQPRQQFNTSIKVLQSFLRQADPNRRYLNYFQKFYNRDGTVVWASTEYVAEVNQQKPPLQSPTSSNQAAVQALPPYPTVIPVAFQGVSAPPPPGNTSGWQVQKVHESAGAGSAWKLPWRQLQRLITPNDVNAKVAVHKDGSSVTALVASHNHDVILAGFSNGSLRAFDPSNPPDQMILKPMGPNITGLVILDQSRDKSVLWDSPRSAEGSSQRSAPQVPFGFSADALGNIWVWRLKLKPSKYFSREQRKDQSESSKYGRSVFECNTGVSALAGDMQGKWLVAGTIDGRIVVLNVTQSCNEHSKIPIAVSQNLATIVAHGDAIRALAVPDPGTGDAVVVSAADDGKAIKVWSLRMGTLLHQLEGHCNVINCLSPVMGHANVVVSGSADRTIGVWDVKNGRCCDVLQGHQGPVMCLSCDEDGTVASGSQDGGVWMWKFNAQLSCDYPCARVFARTGFVEVTAVVVTKQLGVVTGGRDGRIRTDAMKYSLLTNHV